MIINRSGPIFNRDRMELPDTEHFPARRTASDSQLGRCPCTSGLWASSCASDWNLHHRRIRSIRTDFLRSLHSRNRQADRRQTACQREPAMLGPLRSAEANSAEPSTPVTVTSSWSVGQQRLRRLFLALNQRIIKGCAFVDGRPGQTRWQHNLVLSVRGS